MFNFNFKNQLIIDCFAGGGGASVGIEEALGKQVDIAINHDPEAIRMHTINHPSTIHLTEDIFKVNLKKYVNNRNVALMWASPDCTSHSKAKGSQPRENGLRILPWSVYKHAKDINPSVIIMENVEEIQQWGPLDDEGHPIPEKKGEDYEKFINSMKNLGYEFECKELVAADYGVPTTRRRWYAIFRNDGLPINWPKPTHSKDGTVGEKWIGVKDVLDFTNLGNSIFGRKKNLAENTLRRIARGLKKFVLENPEPYIVNITKEEPVTEKIAPYIIQYHSETRSDEVRGQLVGEPIKTIDTSNRYALVNAYLKKYDIENSPIYETKCKYFNNLSIHVVKESDLIKYGIDEEAAKKCTWVSHFIMEYYGQGTGMPVTIPLHTIVTKDRFALITVLGNEYTIMDIYLRILTPEELKLAQGFPKDYILNRDINGRSYPTKEQVARIGNSVVPIMARKIVESNCYYLKIGERVPNMEIAESKTGQLLFA